jgi:hypothetical protein
VIASVPILVTKPLLNVNRMKIIRLTKQNKKFEDFCCFFFSLWVIEIFQAHFNFEFLNFNFSSCYQ